MSPDLPPLSVMNCQRAQQSFLDHQAGTLPAAEAVAVREHLAGCIECQREWSGLQEVVSKLDQLPEEKPSARLRANFYAMLENQPSPSTRLPFGAARNRLDAFFASLLPSRPIFQFAAVAAALAFGLFVGTRSAKSPAIDPGGERTQAQIAELQRKVETMTELVAASLNSQQSANDRLQGVLATLQTRQPDNETLAKLMRTVAFDPSTNVRLSALEALYAHAERPDVRQGVLASLSRESSPLVQLAMIDFLAAVGDADAGPTLQTLTRSSTVDTSVRAAAQRALAQL